MSDPRVLVVVEQLRREVAGGIGTYAEGLLVGLEELASADGGAVDGTPADGSAPGRGLPVAIELLASRRPAGTVGSVDPLPAHGWPLRTSPLPGRVLTRAWDRRLLRAPRDADVLHATSLAFPLRRARAAVPMMTVTVHDLLWREHPEASTRRGRRWHESRLQQALAQADGFVVPSRPVADLLVGAGASVAAIHIIHPGCDHLPAPDPAGADALLGAHGVRGPFLLSVATLEPRKNLRRLVDAYHSIAASLPEPWPLVLVGGAGWGPAEHAVFDPGAVGEGQVVVVGQVSAEVLAALYRQAQLLAYVPLGEGYGMPPMEAALHGLPVVVSDQVPSMATEPGAPPMAVVVDPLDTATIAQGLLAAATDEEMAGAMVAAARPVAGERSWTAAARAHLSLWQSVGR